MRNLVYMPQIGKGELILSLFPLTSNTPVWKNVYPSFVENASDGELEEDPTLIDLGVMKSVYDIDGLCAHLKQIGVIDDSDKVEMKKDFKMGGGIRSTFRGKVSAISKKLEGTKVEKKYQPEYGKRYNHEESVEAATKISGSIVEKENN